MGAVTFTALTGKEGSIRIPALGATIGRIANWSLKRRGDDGPLEGSYDLRASLSYVNPVLFSHSEYSAQREIRLKLGRTTYVLEEKGGSVRLDGMNLDIEGVALKKE